jgi:hypothetical protein
MAATISNPDRQHKLTTATLALRYCRLSRRVGRNREPFAHGLEAPGRDQADGNADRHDRQSERFGGRGTNPACCLDHNVRPLAERAVAGAAARMAPPGTLPADFRSGFTP